MNDPVTFPSVSPGQYPSRRGPIMVEDLWVFKEEITTNKVDTVVVVIK